LISQLRDDQVRQAFQAAGASTADVEAFSAQVMARIKELRAASLAKIENQGDGLANCSRRDIALFRSLA
jgi:hypothetical protein